jgi:hypothetical protein
MGRFQVLTVPLLHAYSGDVDRAIRVMPITQTGHVDR